MCKWELSQTTLTIWATLLTQIYPLLSYELCLNNSALIVGQPTTWSQYNMSVISIVHEPVKKHKKKKFEPLFTIGLNAQTPQDQTSIILYLLFYLN